MEKSDDIKKEKDIDEGLIDFEVLEHLKYVFQDCNINFLIGSGLSTPFFQTLGSIEIWLTALETLFSGRGISEDQYIFLKASLYKAYFEVSMKDNQRLKKFDKRKVSFREIKDEDRVKTKKNKKLENTFYSYYEFLRTLNHILYERRSNTVTKQVNLFTTNIDIFLEKTLENLDLQFNDGFNGVYRKIFGLNNFKKSYFQKSLHYDNVFEIPVFNLIKLHGSVTWQQDGDSVIFSDFKLLRELKELSDSSELLDVLAINAEYWEENSEDVSIVELATKMEELELLEELDIDSAKEFVEKYNELQVVNPTKEKFRTTTFNKNYYELLRLYSNELEKENSVLFVLGFSMADEHIREITLRALKSNPTLKIFFVTYSESGQDIKDNFKKNKVEIDSVPNASFVSPENGYDLKRFNETILIPMLNDITKSSFRNQ